MKGHINLIVDERTSSREGAKLSVQPMILPGLILVLILVLGVSFSWQSKRAARIAAQVQTLQTQRDGLQASLLQMSRVPDQSSTGSRQDPLTGVLGARTNWAEVIREISWMVPDGVFLTDIDSRGGSQDEKSAGTSNTIKFTGSAVSHGVIAKFLSQLERSGRFDHVALVFAEKSEAGGGMVGFEITGELKNSVT